MPPPVEARIDPSLAVTVEDRRGEWMPPDQMAKVQQQLILQPRLEAASRSLDNRRVDAGVPPAGFDD